MKKKTIKYLLISAFIAAGLLFLKNVYVKDILVLENGTIIISDNTTASDGDIFYRSDRKTGYVEEGAVSEMYLNGFHGLRDFQKRIVCHLTTVVESMRTSILGNRDKIGENIFLLGIMALLGLAVCGGIFFVIKRYSAAGKAAQSKVPDAVKTTRPIQFALTSIQSVQRFFLNLFRHQLGVPEDTPAQIVTVPGKSSDSRQIYELKVKHKGEWKSRRMTVSPLGEGTGSKSQCFYVIYDTHIVVKIPPSPIKDFKDYVGRIREETAIVAKLAPMECIIPGISVILRKISAFPDRNEVVLKALEEKCVKWLEVNPEFQDYLKVDNAFVFFMDLSRYYFLSRVMESLHDVENQIHKEIAGDVDAVWNYHGFESKYGDYDDSTCFNLQNLYKQFDVDVRPVLKTSGQAKSMGETQKKMLFLSYLLGKDSKENYRGLSDQLVQQVNLPLNKIKAENADVVETYGKLVKEDVRRRMLNRNKPQMEGIITNLLVLLASMGEKKVAMRDLKPDNLIVAGDPANYPAFLFSAEDYTIGLIDVETAVDFETRGKKELPQPYLGGTPLYATPSHFFLNVVLNGIYSDLPQILHLQDWYAMAGIIYELATGKHLFRKTGGKVHGFMRTIQSALAEKREISEVYKEISHVFWSSAKEEFDKNIGAAEKLLKSLHAEIPEDTKQWFEVYVQEKKAAIDTRIKTTIQSQTHFKSEKNRQSLFGYSHEETCRLKARYKQPDRPAKSADRDVSLILQLLDDLALLKKESERLSEMIKALNAPFPKLSACDILVIMYGVVADAMYHPEWETLSVEPDEIELSAEVERTLGYTLTVQAPS
ncbi:hypothetical protein ACFL03_11280 [Thermodesulfobacteriota bacterium]